MHEHVALAAELGMTKAVEQAEKDEALTKSLLVAYQNYAFISQEKIDAFCARLQQKTLTTTGRAGWDLHHHYDTLKLEPLETYPGLPPVDVLTQVKAAKQRGIFTRFEVASIESVNEYKDPIVFGIVEGCSDRFYIGEWGEDVSMADLMSGEPR